MLASLLDAYQFVWGETGTRLLTTFMGILIGAFVIKLILGFMDATVSLTVAVVTMIIGSLVPLLISSASTPARLQAETHAAHTSPVVLPIVGFGFNALTALLWIANLLGRALIIQSFSSPSE